MRILNAMLMVLVVTALSTVAVRAADSKPAARAAKSPDLSSLFEDKVVARGKGFEIRIGQVEEEFTAFKVNMAAAGKVIPDDKRDEFMDQILNRLIVTRLMMAKATDADRKKATEAVDKYMAQARGNLSEEAFNRQVLTTGMTPEQFQAKLMERATVEEVFIREVKSKLIITDDAAHKFYDENPTRFDRPEMVRASHLLISTREPIAKQELSDEEKKQKRQMADKLLARAKAGEDFAKLVAQYSEAPGSKDTSGEYTFVRGQMLPEFENVAFSLGTNEVSGVITTGYGYHIIKVLEKFPKNKVEFVKALPDIKEFLIQQEAEKELPAYVEAAKKEAGVAIVAPGFKPVTKY